MLLQNLESKNLIRPPDWLACNTMYLTIMGSQAYGVANQDSDFDLYGWCIPKKEMVFPHLANKLVGFDKDLGQFEQWQEHHVVDPDALGGKGREYDFQIFGICKYFSLLLDANPNILDSIFVPANCIVHCTRIGTIVRDNRKLFLHKGAFHRFKGYAYSQLHKMSSKDPKVGGKRRELRDKFGFDVKYGYHLVRLISEVEQIMAEGDLDLQRNNEQLKAIRRGEWTEKQIRDYFTQKEKSLETLYNESKLPYSADKSKVKALLLRCLEEHFGSLDKCVTSVDRPTELLREIKELLVRNNI